MKKNLLEETLQTLTQFGKSPEDVVWVGLRVDFFDEGPTSVFHYGTWGDFVEAADFTYDTDYGEAEIPESLRIVGVDWWLERGEYDGSEWWEFKTQPIRYPGLPFSPEILRDHRGGF